MPTSFHTVLAVVTVLSFGLSLQADPPINPIPRAVKSTILYTWDFEDSAQGWVAENQCTLSTTNGQLLIRSTGSDPYMHSPVDFPGGQVAVQLRVRCKVGGAGSVFWTTDKFPRRGEDQRADFSIPDDGQWHETQTRFQAPGRLKDLRIDPGFNPGLIEIDWIRIVQEELHPLSISAVEQKNGIVRFLVSNDRDMAVTFQLDAATRSVPANDTLAIDRPIPGTQPLESVSVTLDCESWPPLTRSVWVANPQVQTRWIEKSLDGFNMKIAQNGSVAFVYRGDQLVATLGPLVLCDGQLPDLKPGEDGAAIRFEGDDIRLSLTPQGSEVTVHVDSTRHCEGPVVRAVGSLEQGLFAGLEYLGKGESSSSRLDIETDEHVRFAPDPMKVTLPLMTFVTDRASIAVTWNDMTLQPVYATPNFFDGSEDHRMTLQGRDITATIRFDTSPLEDSIAWAVEEHGLPVLPPAPRTNAEQSAICLAALNGPLKTKDGWGHCAQENWARQPFADMASTLWRLGGDVPTFDRFAFGGAHVPNGTIYFVTGRAQQWLDIQRQQVRNHIQGQQADGSYRYNGKYRRGHFEDTASGVCALPAARLLEFAYITGDQEALDAGLRTLEFMKRFRTPRGAQVWEVPLHTPDQLASAYLVWAYTRGYQLTGNREYLQHARSGPFPGSPLHTFGVASQSWPTRRRLCSAPRIGLPPTGWDCLSSGSEAFTPML